MNVKLAAVFWIPYGAKSASSSTSDLTGVSRAASGCARGFALATGRAGGQNSTERDVRRHHSNVLLKPPRDDNNEVAHRAARF